MAEGTRIRGLDERLGVQLTEMNEGLTKPREEVAQQVAAEMNQRMDKMDRNFEELKQLIMGFQRSGREEVQVVTPGVEKGVEEGTNSRDNCRTEMAEKQKESSSSARSTDKTSLLDMDIGNDFLTYWKSVSVAEDDPMDFDFSKIAKGNKKAFNFDNVNMDFNLDAFFGKLSSFNLDMPDLDVSSPIKKSAKPTEKSKEVSTDGKTPRKSDRLTFQFDFNEFEDTSFGPSFTKKAKQTNANKDAEISASLSGSLGFGIQPKETITATEEETNSKFDSQLGAPNFCSKEKPQESLTEEHFPSKSEMANDQVTNTGPTPLLEKPISNSTQQPYQDNFPKDGTTLPEPHAKEKYKKLSIQSVSENSSNQQTASNSQEEVSCLSRKERTHTGSEQSIVHKKADFGIDRENLQMGELPVDMPRSHSSNNQNSQLSGDNPVPLDGKDNVGPAQGDSQFEQTLTTSASNAILADNEKHVVQKTTEVFGSTERKRLANITNIQQPGPSMVEEELQFTSASTREYIDKLKKENMTLMKLLADRNKIIELTVIELRKLKASLQKMQQQNVQLAQANNQMLTELTIDKDRLKLLQHELECKNGLLVAKGLELKEKDETVPSQKVDKEVKLHNEKLDSSLASRDTIKPSNINRRQQSKSLGPLTVKQSKDKKDDNKRQCVRRQSARLKSEEPKSVDDVFEVESNTLALGPPRNNGMKEDFLSSMTSTKEKEDEIPDSKSIPVRRQSARFKYEEPKPAEVFAVESVDMVSDVVHDFQMHEDVSTSIRVPVEKNDEVSDGRRSSVRRQSDRFKSEEPKPVVDTTAIVSGPVHDDQMPQDVSTSICLPAEKNRRTSDCRRLSVKRQSARFKSVEPEPHPSVYEINTNDCMQIDVSKSTSLSVEKDGIEGESEPQDFGRPYVGRPSRQAVKKVSSYREVPLNVKMRRID